MARMSWLDSDTDLPILDQKVQQLETFIQAMSDGEVDKDELESQESRLIEAMKSVEGDLSDELHEKVTNLLVELTAYDTMRFLHEVQAQALRRRFAG